MKKLAIVMALLCAVCTLSGGEVTFGKPKVKTKECLVFDLNVQMLKGTEVVDALGSRHVHLDWVPRHIVKVLYYQPNSRSYDCYDARVSANGGIHGSGNQQQAIMVMNTFEGGTDGYMTVDLSVASLDKLTPGVTCHLVGRTENKWSEELGRYVLDHGSGMLSGSSNACPWEGWGSLVKAAPKVQSSYAPVMGTFRVRREVLTDAEIARELSR